MKKEIIFLGAGAIGRGYLPWVFPKNYYDYVFVDNDPRLIHNMKKNKKCSSLMARDGFLDRMVIPIKDSYLLNDFSLQQHPNTVAIFVQVGPRNCIQALDKVKNATCPIILCENDSDLVDEAKEVYEKENIFFGVPDVITSNTSPDKYLAEDPLSVVTENGILFIDERAKVPDLLGDIRFISNEELLNKEWKAKLYIHNTPHCIAAYLGALLGRSYLHEAMEIYEVDKIVEGVMIEMLNTLKLKWIIPHEFLDWYAAKELARFRNRLLYDPIARVAREPLRKLAVEGRLIGAANICLAQGFFPENIIKGIVAAVLYDSPKDSDNQISFMRDAIKPSEFFSFILGLRKGEALEIILSDQYHSLCSELTNLVNKYN